MPNSQHSLTGPTAQAASLHLAGVPGLVRGLGEGAATQTANTASSTAASNGSGGSGALSRFKTTLNTLQSYFGHHTEQQRTNLSAGSNGKTDAPVAFSQHCRVLGRWVGRPEIPVEAQARGTQTTAHATAHTPNLIGNNNLLVYRLHWEASAPAWPCSSQATPAAQNVGFEHYLNCLHPNDVQTELQGIRSQMLDRRSSVLSALRMRVDNNGWTHVQVRRDMQFDANNGELAGFTLTVAIDLSIPVSVE